jgi:hypothetical protein
MTCPTSLPIRAGIQNRLVMEGNATLRPLAHVSGNGAGREVWNEMVSSGWLTPFQPDHSRDQAFANSPGTWRE